MTEQILQEGTAFSGDQSSRDSRQPNEGVQDIAEVAVLDEETAAESDRGQKQRAAFGRLLAFGGLLVFVVFLAVALQRQNETGQRESGLAPDFEFTTFEGETIRLEDLAGKGVVLNFWASWCEPCRAEADLLEAIWRREKDNGIIFIGLDYLDQEHKALAYLEEFDITYPNGPDLQSKISRRYRIKGVPETFFIAPDGEIVSNVIGPVLSEESPNQHLDAIRPTN